MFEISAATNLAGTYAAGRASYIEYLMLVSDLMRKSRLKNTRWNICKILGMS